jgi:hypothetical protein
MRKPQIITPDNVLRTSVMPQGADQCIELLEQMLASAKSGDMTWLVVIAGGPSDYGVAHVGSNAAQMNMGIDVAKQEILNRVKVR